MRVDIREFFRIIFQPVWKWVIEILVGIIGLVVFFYPKLQVYLNWPKVSPLLPWYWWVIIGTIVWALATAWEAARVVSAFKDKRASVSIKGIASSFHSLALVWLSPSVFDSNPKPTLVLRGSMPLRSDNLKKGDSVIPDTEFLHVDFINNRTRKAEIPTAHRIRAWVTFFSAQTKHITHEFPGRWEGIEPNHDGISTWKNSDKDESILEVDIPSDGFTRRRLNIAVRFDNTSFAFNNDWYKMVRAEVFALPEKQYYVRIQFGGENIEPSEYWLELINNETETTLTPRRRPIRIGKEIRTPDIEETSTTREEFLGVFANAMQKPPRKKRRKKRK